MKIFLDLDGVLVNFVQGLIDWYDLPFKHDDVTDWDIAKKAGIEEDEFWNGLDESFWKGLKVYPHAYELSDLLTGMDVCILTSPVRNQATGKQIWIRDNLPYFYKEKRYLIGPGKKYIAGPGRILIDDYEGHIYDWEKRGGKGILFPQSWNRNRGKDPLTYVESKLWN